MKSAGGGTREVCVFEHWFFYTVLYVYLCQCVYILELDIVGELISHITIM